jgi:hypothetical protein
MWFTAFTFRMWHNMRLGGATTVSHSGHDDCSTMDNMLLWSLVPPWTSFSSDSMLFGRGSELEPTLNKPTPSMA